MDKCYCCGADIEENKAVIDPDCVQFCSFDCAEKTYRKMGTMYLKCQACGKKIDSEPVRTEQWGACVFCSWKCIEEYAHRGRCDFCDNPLNEVIPVLSFCSDKCKKKAVQHIEWAKLVTGLWRVRNK